MPYGNLGGTEFTTPLHLNKFEGVVAAQLHDIEEAVRAHEETYLAHVHV